MPTQPRIYLAGPEVFTRDPLALGAAKRRICASHQLAGVYPMDQMVLPAGLAPREQGRAIAASIERVMRSCDAAIINMTPFHGPSMDVGTAYEAGFMRGLGRPVFGYSNSATPFRERVSAFWGGAITLRPSGALEGPDGMELEDFSLADNLMIEGGLAGSGGFLLTGEVAEAERYTSLVIFERLVPMVARALGAAPPA